jgi:hypothetical protein
MVYSKAIAPEDPGDASQLASLMRKPELNSNGRASIVLTNS